MNTKRASDRNCPMMVIKFRMLVSPESDLEAEQGTEGIVESFIYSSIKTVLENDTV